MMTPIEVLSVLTIISSIGMRLSPFPDFYWVYKHKETGEVQVLPVVTLCVASAMSALYAYVIEDFVPLFATNTFGVFTALFFIWVFVVVTDDRKYVYKVCGYGAVAVAVVMIYTILAVTGLTNQPRSQAGTVLGWVTIIMSIIQCSSPLATLKHVIVTKSAASMPFTLCLMSTINCALWLAYGAVKWNVFLVAPNVVSVALGTTQVVLCIVYRPSRLRGVKPAVVGLPLATTDDSIVIEMDRSQRGSLERVPSFLLKGGAVFVELASPARCER
jgi:solute carrier family 50 protein (sugar transporter)